MNIANFATSVTAAHFAEDLQTFGEILDKKSKMQKHVK